MIVYILFVTMGMKAMPCLNAEGMALGRIHIIGGGMGHHCVTENVNI